MANIVDVNVVSVDSSTLKSIQDTNKTLLNSQKTTEDIKKGLFGSGNPPSNTLYNTISAQNTLLADIQKEIKSITGGTTRIKVDCNCNHGGGSGSPVPLPPSGGSGGSNNSQEIEQLLTEIRDSLKRPNPSSSDSPIPPPTKDVGSKDTKAQENTSQEQARKNAQKFMQDSLNTSVDILSALLDALKSLGRVLTDNFKDIMSKWNTQITHLKDIGIGSYAAASINRYTKKTMDETEKIVGFNISIDKAIKATNAMIDAGMNPRYIRSNNRDLIMGLSSVGINLSPETLREVGQQIFDNTQIKELTQGWAQLSSKNNEWGPDAAELSKWLSSQEYKKVLSITRAQGVDRFSAEKEMQDLFRRAIESGAFQNAEDAWKAVLIDTQRKYGGGAYTAIPENVGTMIGSIQTVLSRAGQTYDFQKEGIVEGQARAVKAYNTDYNTRRDIDMVSAALVAGGNNYIWENIQNNLGLSRHVATQREVEQGQFEGYMPRMAKAVAGVLPVESMGGTSQQLTGNAQTLTNIGTDLVGKVFTTVTGSIGGQIKDALTGMGDVLQSDEKTNLLKRIAQNTDPIPLTLVTGMGASNIPAFLGKVGPSLLAVGGAALILNDIFGLIQDFHKKETSEENSSILSDKIQESFQREFELQSQLTAAIGNGNLAMAEGIRGQLEQQRQLTKQLVADKSASDKETGSAKGGLIGGGTGLALGTIGAIIGVATGGIGIPVALAIAGGAGLLGAGSGHLLGSTGSNTEEIYNEELSKAIGNMPHHEHGTIVTDEEVAVVGEKKKPELIAPLTEPARAKELMEEAASMPSTNPEVKEMLTNGVGDKSFLDKATDFAKEHAATSLAVAGGMVGGLPAALVGYGIGTLIEKGLQDNKPKETLADKIIKYAKSAEGIPYRDGGDSFNHPEKGLVCNMLVEYAYHSAGIPIEKGSVGANYYNKKNPWVITDTPEPGYVIFSNYNIRENNPLAGKLGYCHMGIIGYGNERIHASSKSGHKVVIDKDYVASLAGEKRKAMKNPNYKSYVFGYLRGVDYGKGVASEEIGSLLNNDNQPMPDISANVADMGEGDVLSLEVDPLDTNKDSRSAYKLFVKDYDGKPKILNTALLNNLVSSKVFDENPLFEEYLSKNNPMGMKDPYGELVEYNSFQDGIDAFVKRMENYYPKLGNMNYEEQINYLNRNGSISNSDVMRMSNEKLVTSLNRLNSSIEESNNISKRANMSSAPTSVVGMRSYIK